MKKRIVVMSLISILAVTICVSGAKVLSDLLISNCIALADEDESSKPIWEVTEKSYGINCAKGGSAKCELPPKEDPNESGDPGLA